MAENEGQYQFSIRLNTEQLRHDVATAQAAFNNLTQGVGRAGDNMRGATKEIDHMDNSLQKLQNSLLKVGAGLGLMQLAKQVVNVRAEFQSLEIAFGTLLGNKEKADKLMVELAELAATTPFGLQEVSQAAKQLLAFGSTAEDVSEEIIMLGDIASGLSIPLGDLIYLYGTTRAQGQLFTQDLRQFMGRGIPLAAELAKQFGVTEQEVSALVTAGKVGFEDVQKALQSLTAEGSMFGGGMQKQSEGIKGQISNIQDSIDSMFNEIGKSSDGLINMTLEGVSWVVEHWRELLNILKYVVAAYGAYKAAIILVAAAHKAMALATVAGRFIQVAKGVTTLTQAMRVLNTVVKANPLGIIASVLATVAASFIDVAGSAEEASSGIDEVDNAADDAARTMGRLEQATADARAEIDEMFDKILDPNTSQDERIKMLVKLKDMYPSIADAIDLERLATENLTDAKAKLNEELEREQRLNAATDKKKAAQDAYNAAKVEAQRSDIIPKVQAEIDRYRQTGQLPYYTISDSLYDTDVIADMIATGSKQKAEEYGEEIKEAVRASIKNDLKVTYDKAATGLIDEKEFLEMLELVDQHARIKASMVADKYVWNKNKPQGDEMPGYAFNNFNISGIEESVWLKTLRKREQELDKANKNLEAATREYNDTLASLGIVDTNVGDEYMQRTSSYIAEYNDAKNAVLDAEEKLRQAIADDDRNKVTQYSEELKIAEENYDKIAKPYEDYLKHQEKLMEEERKQREKIANMNKKLMDDAAQARVDAMEDGFEKEMAQLDLNFDREIRKIEEQETELRKLQGGKLTQEQIAAYDAMRNKAINDYTNKSTVIIFGDPQDYDKQLKEAEASWDDYLAEYGTFQERLAAIKRNYDRQLAEADTEGEKAAIRRERDAVLAEYNVEAQGFARNLADKTLSEIETITKQLQTEVEAKQAAYDALDSSDSDQAKALIAEIDILNAKIKALEELTGKASDNLAKDKWDGATEVFQNIAECANEAAEGLEEYDKGLATAFKAMGKIASVGVNLAGAIKGVKTAFDAANESISGMEKASAILAVISVAIQAVSALVELFKGLGEESEIEKTTRLFGELNTEVERLREASRIDSFDGTIFGKDGFGNFNNNLAVMRDALDALEATQERIAKRGKEWIVEYDNGHVEMTDKSNLAIDKSKSWDSAYESVANMQVQTKHKTWFTQAKYSSLEELFPELFAGGELSLEALKKLQDSDLYNKLSKENRDLIDELISNWEMYEDAVTATEEYLTDIFGDMGSTMTDALVDAFRNGTDAAEAFGEAASDVIERLSTDMIHSAFIQPILDKYDEAIKAMNAENMSPEERMARLTQLIGDMSKEVLATQDVVDEAAQRVREEAEANGIDGVYDSEGTSQSATSKGFAAMSQETGSELNGRFTDIQGQTHRIAEAVEFCRNIQASHLQHLQSVSNTLASIHNDTTLIASHTRALSEIRDDISTIRRSIDNGAL
jgi:tape measure domain-containing protein